MSINNYGTYRSNIIGVLLSFEKILEKDIVSSDFASLAYIKTFESRPHISKSEIDKYSNVSYLGINEHSMMKYNGRDIRYVAITSLIYDFVIIVYEINSSSLFVGRAYDRLQDAEEGIKKFVNSLKGRGNFEGRVIGLQNNQEIQTMKEAVDILRKYDISIYEIDIFGDQIRNIAIDSKLGVTYNILMFDKLYRPGELKNNMDVADFEKSSEEGKLADRSIFTKS